MKISGVDSRAQTLGLLCLQDPAVTPYFKLGKKVLHRVAALNLWVSTPLGGGRGPTTLSEGLAPDHQKARMFTLRFITVAKVYL